VVDRRVYVEFSIPSVPYDHARARSFIVWGRSANGSFAAVKRISSSWPDAFTRPGFRGRPLENPERNTKPGKIITYTMRVQFDHVRSLRGASRDYDPSSTRTPLPTVKNAAQQRTVGGRCGSTPRIFRRSAGRFSGEQVNWKGKKKLNCDSLRVERTINKATVSLIITEDARRDGACAINT